MTLQRCQGGSNEQNRPKSWSLWRSLEAGTSAERKLVCSNNWDRAPPPEHSGEQQVDGLPWPLVPSSATIPSNNFTRCHLGRRMERSRDRWPQSRVHLTHDEPQSGVSPVKLETCSASCSAGRRKSTWALGKISAHKCQLVLIF